MSADLKTKALRILKSALGDPNANFQSQQWEAISALAEYRQRVLLVQRTGWGKSAVYFISTRLLRDRGFGPTIIISPLLALMRNQIDSAAKYGVRLGTHNSSNTTELNRQAEAAFLADELDALIISPERLSNPEFFETVLQPVADKIGLFVIDEAHCISDWGHDFRPDYKRIRNIIAMLPVNVPIVATTATANDRVMADIGAQVGAHNNMIRGPLSRRSLVLQNLQFPKRSHRLAWLADALPTIEGSGIIYTLTTRDAEQVAEWLRSRGIDAHAYYGALKGLTSEESALKRQQLEEDLSANRIKALVSTSALGMGYDKPDLAFVIHYQAPGSVISYYQQAGRAGRGIPKAHAVLMSGTEDNDIQEYFIANAFPKEQAVQDILRTLEKADRGMSPAEIKALVNTPDGKIDTALKFLQAESPAPIVLSDLKPKRYARTVNDYELPRDTIDRLSALRHGEWNVLQQYIGYDQCLMKFLSTELDDPEPEVCGRCANCDPTLALASEFSSETAQAAADFLESVFVPIEPRLTVNPDDFVAYQFPQNLSKKELTFELGRSLATWGEAGWGEIAAEDKRAGHFRDGLVQASHKLITERWRPDPAPDWIAYVPSLQNPELVSSFSHRLARSLGIPCYEVIFKAKRNRQQKFMENSRFRCRNLDGVFRLADKLPTGPVLLVDDAVDSRWTFTVIAALLRQAGLETVYPFAVVSTATRS